jgi:hypothetical protein
MEDMKTLRAIERALLTEVGGSRELVVELFNESTREL